MARAGSRALSFDAAHAPLELRRGAGWAAAVHPDWRAALERAGWLRAAPFVDRDEAPTPLPDRQSGRGAVYRVSLGVGTAVLRPLRRGGWLGRLLGPRLFGPARPLAELYVTAALRTLGASVPEPVLALAWRAGGPFWRGLVATREVSGARDGHTFLASRPSKSEIREVLAVTGSTLRRFHDVGGRHPDLNLGNLLVRNAGADAGHRAEVWVIDLDGARVGTAVSARRRMRELMRLYRSLRKNGAADRDRLAAYLFHSYWAGNRALRSRMLRWRRLYSLEVAIHALRYRGG